MASYGPHVNDSSMSTDGHKPQPALSGDKSLYGSVADCHYVAPERGAQGIQVTTGEGETITLPGILGRYQRGAGIVYLLPTPWGEPYHADAVELARGEAWERVGEHAAALWSKSSVYRTIWHEVATAWPLTAPSPRITEGRPPLAPPLAPLTEDEDTARDLWASMAHRLTPTGRMVVGLALTSPWIEPAGATSSVLALWGEAGEGKSLLARLCAALYGTSGPGGLFGTFNSSGQGLTSHAQDLAHLPIILDEVQSATGDVEAQMRALVSGAERKRSSKAGSSVRSAARWGGLVITTSNEPSSLQHEMFDRRLLEVQVCDLWTGVPDVSDWNGRTAWWRTVADALTYMAGWPWHALTRQFVPGTASATGVCDAARTIPMPGTGNLGQLGTLACVGTQWLAEWTGEPTWNGGVWDASAAVIAERAEHQHDPARDAARAILDDYVTNPGAYTRGSDREVRGFLSSAGDLTCVCGVNHDDEECLWLNVYASAVREVMDMPLARLGRTKFRRAMHTPEGASHLTRKVRQSDGTRTRVATVCLGALADLAEPTAPAQRPEHAPEVPVLDFPEPEPSPFDVQVAAMPTAGTVSVQVTEHNARSAADEEDEENEDRERRVFGHTDQDHDEDSTLDHAREQGLTDLVVPRKWRPQRCEKWDTHNWSGRSSGRLHAPDGHAIRVWRVPTSRVSPEEYEKAQVIFRETTGLNFRSEPTLAHRLLLNADVQGKTPLWQLPAEQADLWVSSDVLHARQWGDRDDHAVTQYDRNKSYLGALTQANLAPLFYGEKFEQYGADAPVSRSLAGMYQIEIPTWTSPLPAPHANAEAGEVLWTTAEIMRLYAETGTEVRVIGAHLAPVHRIAAMEKLVVRCKNWLAEMDGPERVIPKVLYQSVASSLTSESFRARRSRIYRPDWGNAIADNSWANVLRRAYKVYQADERFVPVRVNVDALYYPDSLPTPPELPIGDGLGQFKIEG